MRVLYTATQHGMNPTRAFGAPLYRGFLHLLVYLSGVAVLHTRRGRVMPTVGVPRRNEQQFDKRPARTTVTQDLDNSEPCDLR